VKTGIYVDTLSIQQVEDCTYAAYNLANNVAFGGCNGGGSEEDAFDVRIN